MTARNPPNPIFADIEDIVRPYNNAAKYDSQVIGAIQLAYYRGLHKNSKIESQEMANDYIKDPSPADVAYDLLRIFRSAEFEAVSGFGKIDVIEDIKMYSGSPCVIHFRVDKKQFWITVETLGVQDG